MSTSFTVLLFGDYTDPWLEPINCIIEEATSTPWLHSFLKDAAVILKSQTEAMDPKLRKGFAGGNFTSLQQVADMYRDDIDDVGFVHAVMVYIMRAVMLLRYVLFC